MSDDLISRQAAIDIFDDYNIAVENGEIESYRRYREQLSNLPSVQPPKTGRWKSLFGAVGKVFECSECGAAVTVAYECFKDGCYYDYCPNCGARMRMEDVQNKY